MTELEILNSLKAELSETQLKSIELRQTDSIVNPFYWKGRDKFFICKKCGKEVQIASKYLSTKRYNSLVCGKCNRRKYKKRKKETTKRIKIEDYAKQIEELYFQGFSRNAISKILGISHTPVYKYVKEKINAK